MKRLTLLMLAAGWLAGCSGPPKLLYPTGENRIPFRSTAASPGTSAPTTGASGPGAAAVVPPAAPASGARGNGEGS